MPPKDWKLAHPDLFAVLQFVDEWREHLPAWKEERKMAGQYGQCEEYYLLGQTAAWERIRVYLVERMTRLDAEFAKARYQMAFSLESPEKKEGGE